MSTNAASWFYQEPEQIPFLISERVNGTFWQARIADVYWTCTSAEAPFRVEGILGGDPISVEWVPREYLRLRGPAQGRMDDHRRAISERIIAIEPSLTYIDKDGNRVYEWHVDGGAKRWREIQGRPEYSYPERLAVQ